MKAAVALAVAAALYVLVAWAVRPGFYDCCAGPTYAYVSPPPIVAPGNVAPTSGSGTIGPAGGTVATRDQPTAQAAITVPAGALPGPTTVRITPYAPPKASAVTLTGNVYCITAGSDLAAAARVTLLVPAYQPFPDAIYRAERSDSTAWSSLGGSFDQLTYLMSASTSKLGCFATGYRTPTGGSAPRVGGSLLPLVVAVLVAVVVLAGLPLALRRRRG